MAVTGKNDGKHAEDDEDFELTSQQIITQTFQSLDKQIDALDLIPKEANEKADDILKLMFSDKDIFLNLEGQLTFITCLRKLSEEVGHAFETILEIELSKQRAKPDMPMLPMPQLPAQQVERPNPQILLQQGPQKGGGWADYFGMRRWSSTIDKIFATQQNMINQPQSATSKVIDILDYGRELVSQYNLTLDFFSKGIDHLYFFNDPDTHERQHKQLAMHLTKIVNIICSFSRTIVEYRKERFGDRKASVASGILYVEAAKAGGMMRPYISPLNPQTPPLGLNIPGRKPHE